MTALVISLALVALLIVALQPAHSRSWRPGFDSRVDRDRARLADELLLLASFTELSDLQLAIGSRDSDKSARERSGSPAHQQAQRHEPEQRRGQVGDHQDGGLDEAAGARPVRAEQPERAAGQAQRHPEGRQAA